MQRMVHGRKGTIEDVLVLPVRDLTSGRLIQHQWLTSQMLYWMNGNTFP